MSVLEVGVSRLWCSWRGQLAPLFCEWAGGRTARLHALHSWPCSYDPFPLGQLCAYFGSLVGHLRSVLPDFHKAGRELFDSQLHSALAGSGHIPLSWKGHSKGADVCECIRSWLWSEHIQFFYMFY